MEQILEAGYKLSLGVLGMAVRLILAEVHPAVVDHHIEGSEEEGLIVEHLLIAPEQGGPVLLGVVGIPAGLALVGKQVLEAAGQSGL